MRQPDLDELPRTASISGRQFGWMARERNNKDEMLLERIQKIIKGSIGLRWDKVYSDICKICPKRLRYYIDYYIHLHCYEKNGQIYTSDDKNLKDYHWRPVYVLDDIIREIPKPPKKKWGTIKKVPFVTYNNRNYIYFGKVWAEVEFAYWQDIWDKNRDDRLIYPWLNFPWDICFGRVSRADAFHFWGQEIVCVRKKMCGKKLIRKLNQAFNMENQ